MDNQIGSVVTGDAVVVEPVTAEGGKVNVGVTFAKLQKSIKVATDKLGAATVAGDSKGVAKAQKTFERRQEFMTRFLRAMSAYNSALQKRAQKPTYENRAEVAATWARVKTFCKAHGN